MNAPENKSPPIIPINIKVICCPRLGTVSIGVSNKAFPSPTYVLLPGTRKIIPVIRKTDFGDSVIFEDIRVGLCKLYDRPIDRGYEQTGELADVADSFESVGRK